MPCATVHLHLSDRILLRWERAPGSAPFPATDPNLREAFRHGSLAPDMGFVPGVDRLVSELAHYVEPAELTRSISPPPEAPFFKDGNVSLLTGALEATYGFPWTRREVLVGHHRAVRLTAFWPRAIRLVADGKPARGALRRAAAAGLGLVRRAGRRLTGSESPLRGFLTSIEPPPWLVESVLSCDEEIPNLLERPVQEGPHALENRNLETGDLAGPGLGHPPSDMAVRKLERRWNGGAVHGGSGGGPGDGIL